MLKKLLCAGFVLAAGSAQAAIVEYNYTGETFFPTGPTGQYLTEEDLELCGSFCVIPESLPGIMVRLVVDEDLIPGGTLAGATLTYYGSSLPQDLPLPAYLVEFTLTQEIPYDLTTFVGAGLYGWAFPEYVWGNYTFVFDDAKTLISWGIDIGCGSCYLDHLSMDPGGASFDLGFWDGTGSRYTAAPGTWTTPAAPIPLPATAWLMLGLIGGLGVKAWRARNQPPS